MPHDLRQPSNRAVAPADHAIGWGLAFAAALWLIWLSTGRMDLWLVPSAWAAGVVFYAAALGLMRRSQPPFPIYPAEYLAISKGWALAVFYLLRISTAYGPSWSAMDEGEQFIWSGVVHGANQCLQGVIYGVAAAVSPIPWRWRNWLVLSSMFALADAIRWLLIISLYYSASEYARLLFDADWVQMGALLLPLIALHYAIIADAWEQRSYPWTHQVCWAALLWMGYVTLVLMVLRSGLELLGYG